MGKEIPGGGEIRCRYCQQIVKRHGVQAKYPHTLVGPLNLIACIPCGRARGETGTIYPSVWTIFLGVVRAKPAN